MTSLHFRFIFLPAFILLAAFCQAQTDNQEFENLVKLGELYSRNVNCTGEEFKVTAQALRTDNLNHIIDAMIAVGEGDSRLLSKEFLNRPSETELKYWYVIREIHYNNQSKATPPKANRDVAREVLEKEVDSRWLLDNYYYYRIRGGVATMFNKADLRETDLNLDHYGLKDDTEKAILFFSVTTALTQRFKVLVMVKNFDKLLEFAGRMPTVNGRPYFEYTAFQFSDFEWQGYDTMESYKKRHIGNLYGAIGAYLTALTEKSRSDEIARLYDRSILSSPDYFMYSGGMEKDLQELYRRTKQNGIETE
jgi:hypothetical protein